MSRPPTIAILWESAAAPDPNISEVAAALQRQVSEHFAPVWGRHAEIRCVPAGQAATEDWWLVLLDDTKAGEDRGFHELTWIGLPQATVYLAEVKDGKGKASWSWAASHALLQLLADPFSSLAACRMDRTVTVPTSGGPKVTIAEWQRVGLQLEKRVEQMDTQALQQIEPALRGHPTTVEQLIENETIPVTDLAPVLYAREVCDPCGRDGYLIDEIEVANFVHPCWFSRYGDGPIPGAGTAERENLLRGRFDHLGALREPFQHLANVGVLNPKDGPSATWRLRQHDGTDGGPVEEHSRLWRRTVPLRPFKGPRTLINEYNSIWGAPPQGHP